MNSKEDTLKKDMDARDKILLEEYKCIISSFNLGNEALHRFGTFYFAAITLLLGALFLIAKDGLTTYDIWTVIMLSLVALGTCTFWLFNASRTGMKLASRMDRAKQIEEKFKEKYGDCLQIYTYTGDHLRGDKNSKGYDLKFYERVRGVLARKYPMAYSCLWIIVLFLAISFLILGLQIPDPSQKIIGQKITGNPEIAISFSGTLTDLQTRMQVLAAILFFVGTMLLAFSQKPYNSQQAGKAYMPMITIQWRFRVGLLLNFLGFLLIVLSSFVKLQ